MHVLVLALLKQYILYMNYKIKYASFNMKQY